MNPIFRISQQIIRYATPSLAESLLQQKGVICSCSNCNRNQHRKNGHVEFNITDNFNKTDLNAIKQFLATHTNIKTINFEIDHSFPDEALYNIAKIKFGDIVPSISSHYEISTISLDYFFSSFGVEYTSNDDSDSSSYDSSSYSSDSSFTSSYLSSSSDSSSLSSDYFSDDDRTACHNKDSENKSRYYPLNNPESIDFSKKTSHQEALGEEFDNFSNLSLKRDKSHRIELEKLPLTLKSIKSSQP